MKKFIVLSLCTFGLVSCAELNNLSAELSKLSPNSSFSSSPKTLDDFKAMPLYQFNAVIQDYERAAWNKLDGAPFHVDNKDTKTLASLLVDEYGRRANAIRMFTSEYFFNLSKDIGNQVNKLNVNCNVYGYGDSCEGTVQSTLNFATYCHKSVNDELFNKMALQYGRANTAKLEQTKAELKSACAVFSDPNSPVYNAKLVIESYEKFLQLN